MVLGRGAVSYERGTPVALLEIVVCTVVSFGIPKTLRKVDIWQTLSGFWLGQSRTLLWIPQHLGLRVSPASHPILTTHNSASLMDVALPVYGTSEGRWGRWGTPTMALHVRIQHRDNTDAESQIPCPAGRSHRSRGPPKCPAPPAEFRDLRLTRRGTIHSRDLSGRGTTRAEDAQGGPTQSHISPSILVYEHEGRSRG